MVTTLSANGFWPENRWCALGEKISIHFDGSKAVIGESAKLGVLLEAGYH